MYTRGCKYTWSSWWWATYRSKHVELLKNKWNNKFRYQVASCWLFILSQLLLLLQLVLLDVEIKLLFYGSLCRDIFLQFMQIMTIWNYVTPVWFRFTATSTSVRFSGLTSRLQIYHQWTNQFYSTMTWIRARVCFKAYSVYFHFQGMADTKRVFKFKRKEQKRETWICVGKFIRLFCLYSLFRNLHAFL
jgi:hypothetical protein